MSTLAIWSRVVQSCDVSPHNFDGLAMSVLAISVAPLIHVGYTALSAVSETVHKSTYDSCLRYVTCSVFYKTSFTYRFCEAEVLSTIVLFLVLSLSVYSFDAIRRFLTVFWPFKRTLFISLLILGALFVRHSYHLVNVGGLRS